MATLVTKNCEVCGKTMHRATPRTLYCKVCKKKIAAEHSKANYQRKQIAKMLETTPLADCEKCGRMFGVRGIRRDTEHTNRCTECADDIRKAREFRSTYNEIDDRLRKHHRESVVAQPYASKLGVAQL